MVVLCSSVSCVWSRHQVSHVFVQRTRPSASVLDVGYCISTLLISVIIQRECTEAVRFAFWLSDELFRLIVRSQPGGIMTVTSGVEIA
jgi:hypothetical protein